MAKKKVEEKVNLDSILFKCRDILRAARNSGSFFEKRDMMLTLVFLRFIGEKFEDGIEKLKQDIAAQGLDPENEEIRAAFFDDATFTDGTYNLPVEARWSTIINTPAPQLNVALDTALHIRKPKVLPQKHKAIAKKSFKHSRSNAEEQPTGSNRICHSGIGSISGIRTFPSRRYD